MANDALALDTSGNLYLTGAGGYLSKLDPSGNVVFAILQQAAGVDVDAAGNIFLAGSFNGTSDFDPGPGTYNLTSAGGGDFFVVKLTQTGSMALAAGSASTSSAILLDDHAETAATSADTNFRPTKRAASLDAALAEFDVRRWRKARELN